MISHRGISVITPLPFGGGVGGGATIFSFDSSSAQGSPTSFVIEPFSSVEIILCRQEKYLTVSIRTLGLTTPPNDITILINLNKGLMIFM